MSKGQFRFSYFTPEYGATVAFYGDGLGLPILESWDRGLDDREQQQQHLVLGAVDRLPNLTLVSNWRTTRLNLAILLLPRAG